MKLKISIITITFLIASMFSGCTNIELTPEEMIKANMQVKAFFEQYPNAEIEITHFSESESSVLKNEIIKKCNKLNFVPKELYRFYIKDSNTGLDLVGYLDVKDKNIECIKKKSQENINNSNHNSAIKLKSNVNDNKVTLIWNIENPSNVKYFKVMRSEENSNHEFTHNNEFKKITLENNKKEFQIDFEEVEGNFLYRVSSVLKDEKIIHSNIVQVKIKPQEIKEKVEGEKDKNIEEKVEKKQEEQKEKFVEDFKFEEIEIGYDKDERRIELKWEVNNNNNIKYYKIVKSTTNENPKYPEDGYYRVVNPQKTNEYYAEIYEIEEKKTYYRITAVLEDDSKIHSPVKEITPEIQEAEIKYFELNLEGEHMNYDEKIQLKWEVSDNDDIKYFKVVRSTTNYDPKYPEDGYVKVVNPHDDKKYEIELTENDQKSFYRITTVFKDDTKHHSNVLTFTRDDQVASDISNFEIILNGNYDKNEKRINLEWSVNQNENIKYFKVIKSITGDDLKYPEAEIVDSIYSSDSLQYSSEIYEQYTGTIWYRVTTVFYDDQIHHSDVLEFTTEDETDIVNDENGTSIDTDDNSTVN